MHAGVPSPCLNFLAVSITCQSVLTVKCLCESRAMKSKLPHCTTVYNEDQTKYRILPRVQIYKNIRDSLYDRGTKISIDHIIFLSFNFIVITKF